MPSEHLRALVHELHPNVSVRELERAAGLPAGKIAYFLKLSTQLTTMPLPETMKEIARALACDLLDVVECFAADVGLPWGPDPSLTGNVKRLARVLGVDLDIIDEIANDPSLRQLIRERRRLSPADRDTLHRFALSMAGGPARELPAEDHAPDRPTSRLYRPRGGSAHVARGRERGAH